MKPDSIEIFFAILFALTGSSSIGSHVPSTVPFAFNLLQVAEITNSFLRIVFVNSCHTILYAVSNVPVFFTDTSFVVDHPGFICCAFIAGPSVYVSFKVPASTTTFLAFSLPLILALKYA